MHAVGADRISLNRLNPPTFPGVRQTTIMPDQFFTAQERPMYIAEASGYLDPGGGLCDAAGSLVLHWPTRERVKVIVGHSAHAAIRVYAGGALVEVPLAALRRGTALLRAEELRARISAHTEAAWAAPVIGCCTELWRMLYRDGAGVELYIEHALPSGTHAETATLVVLLEALCELYETHMTGISLPLVAQRAMRRVAQRPLPLTGLLTTYFGKLGKILPVRSQQRRTATRIATPALRTDVRAGEVHEAFELPDDTYLVGIVLPDLAVDAAAEPALRTAISMAYSIVATRQGADRAALRRARQDGRYGDLPYAGFLGTVDYDWMYRDYERLLPATMTGDTFLTTYGPPIDPFVTVDPVRHYALRRAGLWPIYTNFQHQQLLDELTRVAAGQLHGEEWTRTWGALLNATYALQTAFDQVPEAVRLLHDFLQHEALDHRLYGLSLGAPHTGLLTAVVYGEAALDWLEARVNEFGEAYDLTTRLLLP